MAWIIQMKLRGVSHAEAARALGVPPGNVRAAYHEAVETLREKIKWAA